jgi:hypothetical protein
MSKHWKHFIWHLYWGKIDFLSIGEITSSISCLLSLRMSKYFVILLFYLCTIFSVANCSNKKMRDLRCFETGACSNSYHVDGDSKPNKNDCLQYCKESQSCSWFTYYPSFEYCQLFANCSTLEVELCPTCVSGQVIKL